METRPYAQTENAEAATSIVDMAMGQIKEKINYEMSRIIKNILDDKTNATEKRVLNIKITVEPQADRRMFTATAAVSSKLAAPRAAFTTLKLFEENGTIVGKEVLTELDGQTDMDGFVVPPPKELKVVK